MKNFGPGFTLIELLVVIAIIGILAAVALPLYKGYTIIAKLSEVENAMSTAASAVTAYHQDQNTWPNCPMINEVGNSLGVSMANVSRISGISIINEVITVTIHNIDAMVNGKTLTLTPTLNADESIRWAWG